VVVEGGGRQNKVLNQAVGRERKKRCARRIAKNTIGGESLRHMYT